MLVWAKILVIVPELQFSCSAQLLNEETSCRPSGRPALSKCNVINQFKKCKLHMKWDHVQTEIRDIRISDKLYSYLTLGQINYSNSVLYRDLIKILVVCLRILLQLIMITVNAFTRRGILRWSIYEVLHSEVLMWVNSNLTCGVWGSSRSNFV